MFLSQTDVDRCAWGCAMLLSPNPWSFSVDKGNDWKQTRRHRGTREWKWSSNQRPGKTERCAAGNPGKCVHRLSTRTRRTFLFFPGKPGHTDDQGCDRCLQTRGSHIGPLLQVRLHGSSATFNLQSSASLDLDIRPQGTSALSFDAEDAGSCGEGSIDEEDAAVREVEDSGEVVLGSGESDDPEIDWWEELLEQLANQLIHKRFFIVCFCVLTFRSQNTGSPPLLSDLYCVYVCWMKHEGL